ncbi:uncharacterized protein LOC111884764 [Lactuca sativa]|uniref:GRF-type domain-containing protein n=1 Tax=Lactuca sativa TaxID=4236 RepID=A0A9R1V204_LACSA|nr:uncharacterized protein LOC111884764 [Lactuca sativa]KAJ0196868.1 hypothetical protein LSAT_V11C700387350 [Lactuca sativa]
MTTSSSRSSFNGGTRMRNKKVIRCDCGDVCGVSVSRTPDNPGRKFWGCPNYQVEGGNCVFFKWADGELGQNMEMCHTEEIKPLSEVIIGLLVAISLMLGIVVIKM